MNTLQFILKYIRFWISATDAHGIHSPFVFDLYNHLIDKKQYYCFNTIEKTRAKLLLDSTEIEILDLGAGSRIFKDNKRKIADIAKHSLKSKKLSQLLFKLVVFCQPNTIIELGTSLGITTAYLASVNSKSKVYTLEGCPAITQIAQQTFNLNQIKNINLIRGDFNKTFQKVLTEIDSLDFVFIDGNHTKEATLLYFNQCLEKVQEATILVFDDIHWSNRMEQAWETIKENKKVSITIDLFHFGIVFFNPKFQKEHFKLKV